MSGVGRYEEIPEASVERARELLAGAADDQVSELVRVLIGVGLHETDRVPAEEVLRFAVRWRSGAVARAALLGLGHLGRRFGTVEGPTWALVAALHGMDPYAFDGAVDDVYGDLRHFVAEPPIWQPPVLELHGDRIDGYAGFVAEANRTLFPEYAEAVGRPWAGNLDALNDILRGGFGTPEDGFVIRWRHAPQSREALDREGEVPFAVLLEIIATHGPGGTEAADLVFLVLLDD